ncbi:MAG: hypothetical protein ABIO45_13700 [Burkholderiaceae bacterium]
MRHAGAPAAVQIRQAAVGGEKDVLGDALQRIRRAGEVADRQQPHLVARQAQRAAGGGLVHVGRERLQVTLGKIERDDQIAKLFDPGIHELHAPDEPVLGRIGVLRDALSVSTN